MPYDVILLPIREYDKLNKLRGIRELIEMANKASKREYVSSGGRESAVRILTSIITAGLISLAMLALLTFVSVRFNLPQTAVMTAVNAIYALGVTICGILAARRASHGGLLRGAGAGILYAVLLYLIGCAVSGHIGFSAAALTGACAALICGIGGVIGINMRKR